MMVMDSVANGPGAPQGTTITFDGFRDPIENAFTLLVPNGWTVEGGTMRITPVQPVRWLKATSPDDAIQIFIGDPSVPRAYVEPYGSFSEGQIHEMGARIAPAVVLSYRSATAFAQLYGDRRLAGVCTSVEAQDVQPMPDYAQTVFGLVHEAPPIDGGMARFGCERASGRSTAAILAATGVLFRAPEAANSFMPGSLASRVPANLWASGPSLTWAVFDVAGYIAPSGQDGLANGILEHMLATLRLDAQWSAAQLRCQQQEIALQDSDGLEQRALLGSQYQQWTAIALARGDTAHETLVGKQDAFMQQQRAEASDRAADFVNNWLRKDVDTAVFDHAYVKGQSLVWDGKNLEWGPVGVSGRRDGP